MTVAPNCFAFFAFTIRPAVSPEPEPITKISPAPILGPGSCPMADSNPAYD